MVYYKYTYDVDVKLNARQDLGAVPSASTISNCGSLIPAKWDETIER